jgi:hypothetical protein
VIEDKEDKRGNRRSMTVIQLDNATLDKSSSLESASSSESESSSGSEGSSSESSTETTTSDISAVSKVISSESSKDSSGSSEHASDTSQSGSSASKSSFNLLDTIKRSSNKLNREFKKRVKANGSSTSIGTKSGKGGGLTFATITESLSASSEEMMESMTKTFAMFKPPESNVGSVAESRQDFESKNYDLDEDDEEYDWTAVAVPRGFHDGAPSDHSSAIMCPPSVRRDRLLAGRSGEDETRIESPLHSPRSESSDDSSIGEEDGSRAVSLLDTTDSRDYASNSDGEGSGSDSDEEGDTPRSTDSVMYEDYLEMDALAAISGVVYQIGSCNFRDLKADFAADLLDDDYSVGSGVFPTTETPRGRSTCPRTPPPMMHLLEQSKGYLEQSKSYLGLSDDSDQRNEIKAVETPQARTNFFQSMFSCTG